MTERKVIADRLKKLGLENRFKLRRRNGVRFEVFTVTIYDYDTALDANGADMYGRIRGELKTAIEATRKPHWEPIKVTLNVEGKGIVGNWINSDGEAGYMKKDVKKRVRCDQCEALMINGYFCHEAGCPNDGARYDEASGEWIKQVKCFICGYNHDAGETCCTLDDSDDEHLAGTADEEQA